MTKKNLIILGILVLLIILLLVLFASKVSESTEPSTVELPKEPSIFQPLPEAMRGEQIYNITGSEDQRFRISQVIINPLDVEIGDTQTVTVIVEDLDRSDITEENHVTATALTDKDSKIFSLKLIEIEDKEQVLIAVWQGTWDLQDTYNLNYQLAVGALKEGANDSVNITFR